MVLGFGIIVNMKLFRYFGFSFFGTNWFRGEIIVRFEKDSISHNLIGDKYFKSYKSIGSR